MKSAAAVLLNRRKLLVALTTGAGAAVAVARLDQSEDRAPESTSARPAESGYRLTDHVCNYYRAASF